jgi:hypothetical protein
MAQETIAGRIAEDAAVGVQRVSVDGRSVDAMPIDDRIKADQYVQQRGRSLKDSIIGGSIKLVPPGGG